MKSSEINVTAALSYLDQRATGRLSVDNLHKLFTWIKCDLDEKEKDTLLAFLKPDMSKTIDYLQFTALMDIASYDTVKHKKIYLLTDSILCSRRLMIFQPGKSLQDTSLKNYSKRPAA